MSATKVDTSYVHSPGYQHGKAAIQPLIPNSTINNPSHYAQYNIEPITFIMENGMEFWRGNIIKYAARAGAKKYDGMNILDSEITDLEKVRRYAEMRINELKGCSVL